MFSRALRASPKPCLPFTRPLATALPTHHLPHDPPQSPTALLNSQPEKYLITKLHAQTYLLHPTDVLTVPRLKPSPAVGATLKLTRVFEVGSRDFALKAEEGQRLVDVECSLTVLEHTTGPLEIVQKVKRRKGYKKHVRSKHQFTRLRVGDIRVLGEGQAADEQPRERTLNRPVQKPFDQYSPVDRSVRGRLATEFGIVAKEE